MTAQQRAEAYVREKCPELMRLDDGCEVQLTNIAVELGPYLTVGNDYRAWDSSGGSVDVAELNDWVKRRYAKIIGHPIHLQHWLKVLVPNHRFSVNGVGACFEEVSFNPTDRNQVWREFRFNFNLTTGQPATEADAEAFIKLVQN